MGAMGPMMAMWSMGAMGSTGTFPRSPWWIVPRIVFGLSNSLPNRTSPHPIQPHAPYLQALTQAASIVFFVYF